jgi:hypothetical protein
LRERERERQRERDRETETDRDWRMSELAHKSLFKISIFPACFSISFLESLKG